MAILINLFRVNAILVNAILVNAILVNLILVNAILVNAILINTILTTLAVARSKYLVCWPQTVAIGWADSIEPHLTVMIDMLLGTGVAPAIDWRQMVKQQLQQFQSGAPANMAR